MSAENRHNNRFWQGDVIAPGPGLFSRYEEQPIAYCESAELDSNGTLTAKLVLTERGDKLRKEAPTRYLDKPDEVAPDIECWHAFWAAHGTEAMKYAIMFNIHKYNWRLGKKDAEAQEVEKMMNYLGMYKEILEAEAAQKASGTK